MTEQPACRTCSKPISFRKDDEHDKWLRFNPDGTPHVHEQAHRGGPGRTPAELRNIARLTVLKAAANFAATRTDIRSSDVLRIADSWLAWVNDG